MGNRPGLLVGGQGATQAPGQSVQTRSASVVRKREVVAYNHVTEPHSPTSQSGALGTASFYDDAGSETANGEIFNPNKLTAAHPSLPFGTKLRVTNVSNGRSVVVRINDRGPFVPGRIVDLSTSAAETLGMTERGTAKVKLDVVR
jgi:rare lipoprotein A